MPKSPLSGQVTGGSTIANRQCAHPTWVIPTMGGFVPTNAVGFGILVGSNPAGGSKVAVAMPAPVTPATWRHCVLRMCRQQPFAMPSSSPTSIASDWAQFSTANRRTHLFAEAPCRDRRLCNLTGVVLADPVLDHFADFGREFAREISLALRHKPIVVVGARISLSA